MAWIKRVPDANWAETPGLAEQYDSVVDADYGLIDEIMAIHSLKPAGLAAHIALYASAMSGTKTLRKVERELIALVVSLENSCHY